MYIKLKEVLRSPYAVKNGMYDFIRTSKLGYGEIWIGNSRDKLKSPISKMTFNEVIKLLESKYLNSVGLYELRLYSLRKVSNKYSQELFNKDLQEEIINKLLNKKRQLTKWRSGALISTKSVIQELQLDFKCIKTQEVTLDDTYCIYEKDLKEALKL